MELQKNDDTAARNLEKSTIEITLAAIKSVREIAVEGKLPAEIEIYRAGYLAGISRMASLLHGDAEERLLHEPSAQCLNVTGMERMGTGGRTAAAQVLLSAYNGHNLHLDVTDLGRLDSECIRHALRVLWGRNSNPWMEPQRAIENGDNVFGNLWDDWPRLHVRNRWKSVCSDCNGAGWRWVDIDGDDDCRKETCCRCDGRGLFAYVEWPGYENE